LNLSSLIWSGTEQPPTLRAGSFLSYDGLQTGFGVAYILPSGRALAFSLCNQVSAGRVAAKLTAQSEILPLQNSVLWVQRMGSYGLGLEKRYRSGGLGDDFIGGILTVIGGPLHFTAYANTNYEP
jgi:hypothetical protein